MEFSKITVAATREGIYTLSFSINGTNESNLTISLQLNGEEYKEIFTKQSLGEVTYTNTTALANGEYKAKLKANDGTNEVESEEFNILIKPIPSMGEVKVEQENADGSYIISYKINGYQGDLFTTSIQIDGGSYTQISTGSSIGTNIYNGSGLSLGKHTIKIKSVMDKYTIESEVINLEIKVSPKIEDLVISNNDSNGNYKLGYTIVGDNKHTYKVELQINSNEYISILQGTTIGTKTYNGTNMPNGINKCRLKVSDGKDFYITDYFNVIIKDNIGISNIVQTDSNSKGEYKLTFDIKTDPLFLAKVELKVDSNEYETIMTAQTTASKLYNGKGLSLGTHKAKLRISDSEESIESAEFNINIVNKVPVLSYVLVSNENNNGNYTLNYATKDIETNTDNLVHQLKIDSNSYVTIGTTKEDNFFTYNGKGLGVGTHTCYIKVSDGLDETVSESFEIVIPTSYSNIKERLLLCKNDYINKFTAMKQCILNVVSDGLFDSNLENPLIKKALENYKNAYSEYGKVGQLANDSIGTNKVTSAKSELQKAIDGANQSVNNLEITMNGVFKDGLLSDAEKDTINKQLSLISKEKADVDSNYNSLYNNEDLINPTKTNLKTAYDNFVTKHNNLINVITTIVDKTTIVDETDRSNLDKAFEAWRAALSSYNQKGIESLNAIAQKKADDSADKVDKKWADIILDPETGIQAQVGHLQTTLEGTGGIIERLNQAELNITKDAITSIVSESFYTKKEIDTMDFPISIDAIKSIDMQYYLSTSETQTIGGEWKDTLLLPKEGMFLWTRNKITRGDDSIEYKNEVCTTTDDNYTIVFTKETIIVKCDENGNPIN